MQGRNWVIVRVLSLFNSFGCNVAKKVARSAARFTVQSNPVDMDTEEAIESVCISGLLFHQNTTEIKQDTSIVKLNISKLHQAYQGNTYP